MLYYRQALVRLFPCLAAFLGLALSRPAGAGVPFGWTTLDVGGPAVPGLTSVDAAGVWSIFGSGAEVAGNSDQFHFAYRTLAGSGAITARILSQEGGHETWAKTGLMVRESEEPGARNFNFVLTRGVGGYATFRPEPRRGTAGLPAFLFPRVFPLHLRVQRANQEFTGYFSDDGLLWRQATRSVPLALPNQALVGLSATAREDGSVVTATFDRVRVEPGVIGVRDVRACGADRSVLLSWNPLSLAGGYHVYRVVPAAAGGYQYTRLTAAPIAGATYTDDRPGLQNGVRALYAVAPVLSSPGSNGVEGPLVAVTATPVALPNLFGCSIAEGTLSGAASHDAASDTITIRGSGGEIGANDQFYFAARTTVGDVEITARALGLPAGADRDARAGVMLRESLDPGARYAMLWLSPTAGLGFQHRPATDGGSQRAAEIPASEVTTPLWLRLTLRRGVVAAYTSTDGATFDLVGAVQFRPPPGGTLYAGLAVTAGDPRSLAEARFQRLQIRTIP